MGDYDFFTSTLSPSRTGLYGVDFSGPVPPELKIKNLVRLEREVTILAQARNNVTKYWIGACPTNYFSDFGPDRLGLSDF